MKPLSQQNLYEVLDVPFDASQAVIAEAVERAMALYAPGSLATYTLMDPEEERLLAKMLEEARSTLLDPTARARYDERITGPEQPGSQVPSPPAPAMDAVIRAAWPELPPVIPALQPASDEEWEEEPVDGQPAVEAEAAPAPQAPQPAARVEEAPETPPAAAPPTASPRPAPILLEKVVEAPASQQAAPPTPSAPAAPPEPAAPPPAQAEAELVPEDAVWSGAVLRRIREARGMSLQQVSERTKVTRHHVENVEADRFDQLPATVYLRGILLSLARELRLDGQKVARSYLERVASAHPGGPAQRPR
ncbi:MAG TPA: helix-turn-helix domain-containing protein [Anaeromyxobacter sp.]|nr:helix-turn-helix domain-containing protein [Anaeromyxobacter sp.]